MSPDPNHSGLPVTYAALVLPMVFVVLIMLGSGTRVFALGIVFLCLAILFVMPVTVPKPRGIFYMLFPVLAVLFAGFWIWHAFSMTWSLE